MFALPPPPGHTGTHRRHLPPERLASFLCLAWASAASQAPSSQAPAIQLRPAGASLSRLFGCTAVLAVAAASSYSAPAARYSLPCTLGSSAWRQPRPSAPPPDTHQSAPETPPPEPEPRPPPLPVSGRANRVRAQYSVPTAPTPNPLLRRPRLRPRHGDVPGDRTAGGPRCGALLLRAWGWFVCGASPGPYWEWRWGPRGRWKISSGLLGTWLATCYLRDPASFEHTRVSEAVAGVRRMQMPRLAQEGRPCNSWPRQHSFPSSQKNRATRRGTPGVKEG